MKTLAHAGHLIFLPSGMGVLDFRTFLQLGQEKLGMAPPCLKSLYKLLGRYFFLSTGSNITMTLVPKGGIRSV